MTQSTQPQVFSPSQWGVQKAEEYFKPQETDGKVKTGLKVTGRALTDVALTVAAILETVVLGALTGLALPTSYVHEKPEALYNSLKDRTTVAAQAVKNAAKGIAGYDSAETKKPDQPPAPKEGVFGLGWTYKGYGI